MNQETDILEKTLERQRRDKMFRRAVALSNLLVSMADNAQDAFKLLELTMASLVVSLGVEGSEDDIAQTFAKNVGIGVKLMRGITTDPTEAKAN
jgi:hypothetical protein